MNKANETFVARLVVNRLPSLNPLPTRRALERWAAETRHSILNSHAVVHRFDIAGIRSGDITLTDGLTKARALKNLRRRLARVYRVASEFGDYVGQPG